MTLPVDYRHFDEHYRRLRAEGRPGWVYGEDWPFHLHWLEKALDAPYAPRAGEALELGCGAGNWCLVLADRGFRVTGVDLSPRAVAWARDNARQAGHAIDFRLGDVLDLADLADASFDFLLDGFCLHCIIGPDRARLLRNACRLLRPGGLLYVRTWCAEDIRDEHWRDWIDPRTRCQIENGLATRYVGTPRGILDELAAAGLTVLHHEIAPWGGGMLQVHATRR